MEIIKSKNFANGNVYAIKLEDGKLIETTETFLPFYTKDAVGKEQNQLVDGELGSRNERWMIGVSCMSGCPVGCKFCATGQMKGWRNLTAEEIVEQVMLMLELNPLYSPFTAQEFKINYTRMGEPFLNIEEVRKAIEMIDELFPNVHHYLSTIGLQGSDFSWIKDNITLQVSLHSLVPEKRDWLIPVKNKLSLEEMGAIRTKSDLQTTLNLTLVDEDDFDIDLITKYFDPKHFFIKLSPINPNETSEANDMGTGVIEGKNLV